MPTLTSLAMEGPQLLFHTRHKQLDNARHLELPLIDHASSRLVDASLKQDRAKGAKSKVKCYIMLP